MFRNFCTRGGVMPLAPLPISPWKPRGALWELPATHTHIVPKVLAEAGQTRMWA